MESKKEECQFCSNPWKWTILNEDDEKVHVKCDECGDDWTFKHFGRCSKCGFWLTNDGYCEMCDDEE